VRGKLIFLLLYSYSGRWVGKISSSRDLVVWLYFLHCNYVSDEVGVELESLNPNDASDQDEIIRLVFEKEFAVAGEGVKKQMKEALDKLDLYPEQEVMSMIDEMGMPFNEPLRDYRSFFSRVRQYFFNKEKWTKNGVE
jgi:hypothetical protein